MNKKGILGYAFFFILILALVTLWIYSNQYEEKKGGVIGEKKAIGALQMQIISQAKDAEKTLLYIEESAKIALGKSVHNLSYHGGYFDADEKYLGYSVWDYDEAILPVEPKNALSEFININLNPYLVAYDEQHIPLNNYDYYYSKELKGIANSNIIVSSVAFSPGIGEPGDRDNVIKKCTDNICIADLTQRYAKIYDELPYVWGGESPYSYEVSKEDQVNNEKSIFKGVSLSRIQPAGNKRSGQATIPGFDCSGFFWWVFRHAGLVEARLTANDYYQLAKANWQPVCDGECTKDVIKKNGQAGDVLFIAPCDKGVCHIGIYMGNHKLAESSGDKGVIVRTIPDAYFTRIGIQAVYRPGTQVLTADTPSEETYDISAEPEIGIVSVKPSFAIPMEYDISEYQKIREQGFELIKAVQNCADKRCIRTTMNTMQLTDWNLDCTDTDFAAHNFIENFYDCARSTGNMCTCNLSLKKRPEYQKKFSIFHLSETEDMTRLSFNDLDADVSEIGRMLDIFTPLTEEITDDIILYYDSDYDLSINLIQYSEILYKEDDRLSFIQQDMVGDVTFTECEKPKKTYRFCVASKHSAAINGEDKPVVYRFAIR